MARCTFCEGSGQSPYGGPCPRCSGSGSESLSTLSQGSGNLILPQNLSAPGQRSLDNDDPFAGFPIDDYEEEYGLGTDTARPHDFWQSFDTVMAAAKMGVQHDVYTKMLGEYRNLGVSTPRENDIERYVAGRLEYETQQQGNDVYVGRGQFYQSTSMIAPPALSQAYTQMAQYGVSRQELDVTLTRHFGPEFLVNPDPAKIQQVVQQQYGGWINQPGYDEANRRRNPVEMRYTQPGQVARLHGRQKDVTNILKTERRDVLHRGEGGVFSAESFIQSSMAPAGTQPGTTTGVYDPSDPNSAAKMAKQLQRNAAVYKQPDVFRGGENITVRSPMFEVENQPLMGFKGNVAFLLGADINPEGMSRNVADPNLQAATRFTRTFDVEQGRKFNFPEIGKTWNLGAGERVVPFEGANPLRIKGGGNVRLVDVVHGTRERTNQAGKSYTVSTVTPIFERMQNLQDIHAQEKTGASKTVMGFYSQQQMQQWYSPQALRQQYESTGNEEFLRMAEQAEEIQATTGVAPEQYSYNYGKYMENLPGMYWSTRLEEAGKVLGKTRSEMAEWRWGENPEENRKLYDKFYTEIAPQYTRQVRHPIDVHESNLGMYSEIEEPGMRQDLGGGMYRLYTKPVETLYLADMMRVIRGQGGGSSEYIPEEVMNLMQREVPEQARFFEQKGRFHRERAQELRSAALANTGEYQPSKHRQVVTQEMAQGVLTRAQQMLFEKTSYTDTADVPDAVWTGMITEAAAEQEWGRNQLDWGFSTTGASPNAIKHLMTGGPAEGEEFGRIASLQARMFQAVASGSGKMSDLAPAFAEEQEKLARSQMVERSLSGSFATDVSRYGVLGISEDIAANEIVLPDSMFLNSIGGTDLEGEARATALGGTVPILADRAPTLRGGQYGKTSFFKGISQTAYAARGGQLINPSSVLTSSEGAQALGRSDADGDYIRSMVASNLARLDKKTGQLEVRFPEGWRYAKPEEVAARGKMLEVEGQRGSNRREMEAANRMEKYQLGNLREYGPQELNLAARINSQMKMTLGSHYNMLKLVEATAGEKNFDSAFQLFSNVYGIEQVPKELSKYGRRMMDIMSRSSAQWMPVGENAQNRGYAGAYQEMVRSALLAPEVTEGVLGVFVPEGSLEMAQQALPGIRALVSAGKMREAQSSAAGVLTNILEQSGTYEQAGMQTGAGVALAGAMYGAEEGKQRDPSKTMSGLSDEQLMLARDVSRLRQLIKKPVSRDEEDNVARLSTLEQQWRIEEAESIADATGIRIGAARMAPLTDVADERMQRIARAEQRKQAKQLAEQRNTRWRSTYEQVPQNLRGREAANLVDKLVSGKITETEFDETIGLAFAAPDKVKSADDAIRYATKNVVGPRLRAEAAASQPVASTAAVEATTTSSAGASSWNEFRAQHKGQYTASQMSAAYKEWKDTGVAPDPASITSAAVSTATPISAQNLGDLMTVEEIEAFGKTEATNTPATSTPTVSTMGAGGGGRGPTGGGVVAAAAGGGNNDWKKRKEQLAYEIKRFVSGKTVKRVVSSTGGVEVKAKYRVGMDEEAVKRINMVMDAPGSDKIVELARKVATGGQPETREEYDLMTKAKALINDVAKVSSGVQNMSTFHRTSFMEAEHIAAQMPEDQRSAYMKKIEGVLGPYSEQAIMGASALAGVAGLVEEIGIEASETDQWKDKYTTSRLGAQLSGVARLPKSARNVAKMERGWQYADVLRGMYEGNLQFGGRAEAEQYAVSQGLSDKQVDAVARVAGKEGLTNAQRYEAMRADPGLAQYLSGAKQAGNYEKELQEVTKSLIEARKDLAQNTKGMSKTEKEALDAILVGKAKSESNRILGAAYAAEGVSGQARVMGGDAYRGFLKQTDERFQPDALAYGVKSLFSPFSPAGSMIRAVWRMGVGGADENADRAAQVGMAQLRGAAVTGGMADMGDTGPMGDVIRRQNAIADSKVRGAYAFEQAWGWTRGQGGGATMKSVFGPGVAAGFGAYLGLSHLAGVSGMGALGTFLGAAAAPIGAAVGIGGMLLGAGNYAINASEGTAYNQMVSAQEQDILQKGSGASLFNRISAGVSGALRDWGAGSSGNDPIRDALGLYPKNGGTTAQLAAIAEANLARKYSSLTYAERAASKGLVSSRLRARNEVLGLYSDVDVQSGLDEMYAYTGIDTHQINRSTEYENMLAGAMTGNVNWQGAQQSALQLGMGTQGTYRMATTLATKGTYEQNQLMRAYGQMSGLRQYGWMSQDIQNLAGATGELYGTAELSMQRILGGDRRAISKYASGQWQTGLEAQGFDFSGQAWAQSYDDLGFQIGTTGGLRTLQRGTSPDFWNVIKDNPLAAQMAGGRSMRSALHSTFGSGSIADQWGGQSMMELQQLYSNVQLGASNFQQGWERRNFAFQYGNVALATPTAQQVADGTWQPQELTSIEQVGGMYQQQRQVQLAQTALSRTTQAGGTYNGIQFTGNFGFQAEGMANQYNQFMQNWQLQGQQMQLNRSWQLQGFDWQQQDMLTGRNRSLVQRGWQATDLDTGFARANIRFDWQEQDLLRQKAQMGRSNEYDLWNMGWQQRVTSMQRGWQEEDWEWSSQQRQQSYGWNLEDINENIRFASGRQRKQLLKQRERMTITQTQGEERADTEEERAREMWRLEDERFQKQMERFDEERSLQDENWEIQFERLQTQRQWTEDDYNRDRERMNEKNQWEDEDYNRQTERFQATVEYQNQVFELQKRNYDMSLEHFQQDFELRQRQFNENVVAYEEQIKLEDELRRIKEQGDLEDIERARQMLALQQQMVQSKNVMDSASQMFQLMGDAQNAMFLDRLIAFLDKIRQVGSQVGYPPLNTPY